MASEADKLIYVNSNTYRLHADNLRWSLLGGYAAFLATLVGLSQNAVGAVTLANPYITLLAFLLSFAYLWILAVQNWFYNLFARWVDDCEQRLVGNRRLCTLRDFAMGAGAAVSPFHPAFFLAEISVGTVAYFFFTVSLYNADVPIFEPLWNLPRWRQVALWIVCMVLYFVLLNVIFAHWQSWVYARLIRPLSNLYQPLGRIRRP
jgi:hypothetical protein